jgi:hypothetical protein
MTMNLTTMAAETLQFEGKTYLDGRASDPRALGWMEGSPPPADKRITVESDRFFDFPQIRWSLSHIREFRQTVAVRRGDGPRISLGVPSSADAATIEALKFTDLDGRERRLEESLYDSYTDGIVVLHRGRVVYERYFGALSPELPHACFSVTKSYAGTLAAALVHEGLLDDRKLMPHYVPELRGTAWEDATLRQVMDMETGLAFTEDYADKRGSMWAYRLACGRARPVGYDGPRTLCDYLCTVGKEGEHGEVHAYKTINTDVMAWAMARVTGRSFAQLLHERLWQPLGCEEDGYVQVDEVGMPLAGGGLSATVRDLARFGEMMRREGDWNSRQLIPAAVVREVQQGGDRGKFAKAGYRTSPGYSYRNMWYTTHNELDAFEARGIYGQRMYVAPKAEMVVARVASHPLAAANGVEPITPPMLLALGRMLRG